VQLRNFFLLLIAEPQLNHGKITRLTEVNDKSVLITGSKQQKKGGGGRNFPPYIDS